MATFHPTGNWTRLLSSRLETAILLLSKSEAHPLDKLGNLKIWRVGLLLAPLFGYDAPRYVLGDDHRWLKGKIGISTILESWLSGRKRRS